MPEQSTIRRAARDKRQGKSPSTQAGEFVREEMDHIRHGVHGARSTKQAIAIGLSKARRAGIEIPPAAGKRNSRKGSSATHKKQTRKARSSRKRARSSLRALRREGSRAASPSQLSRFAKASARKRGAKKRREAAKRAAWTRARERSRKLS